jgi:hypothetical protein
MASRVLQLSATMKSENGWFMRNAYFFKPIRAA